jgi:hypothetical protein
MKTTKWVLLGIGGGVLLLALLTGCVHEHRTVYAEPLPYYPEGRIVGSDDYVYYPGYQVYYSRGRNLYVYQEGRAWVSRPAPPRVSVDVLFASPSVRLDFHDAPARHHSRVVKQYPKHWAPPESEHGNRNDRKNAPGDRR